ncbi:MAG: ABC transporter permease subunit [Bacilli bacterium]|nr:ABC transporter permease subunit [Bacilli bacterium]
MNIYLHELKSYRKSFLIWSLSLVFMVWMGIVEFLSSKGNNSLSEMYNNLPPSLKTLMGGGDFDVSTAIGYYSILFIYIELTVVIHAALLGVGIISKEERDKTIEFLLTRPISRNSVLIRKTLATFTQILLLNLVLAISSILIFNTNSETPIITGLLKLMIGMLLLQILFSSFGLFMASLKKQHKTAGSIVISVVLVTFIMSILTDLHKNLRFLSHLTPFRYFDAKTLLLESGFKLGYILICIFLSILFLFLSHYFYNKRDLSL